jgi:hypothetical protein
MKEKIQFTVVVMRFVFSCDVEIDRECDSMKGYRTLLRFFLPTHLHQFNKFLRTI